jgi:hypothetical protein
VIHRNIKPSNVLFDNQNQAFLSDFCQVKRSTTVADRLFNEIDGAPNSISPELALGGWNLDHRSDIYSLAALVYEMLAGQPPFPGANPITQALQHVNAVPQDLHTLRPDLPDGVVAAVEWAMSKNPDHRFRTAGEFALILEQQAFYPGLYTRQSRGLRLGAVIRTVLLSLLTLLAAAFGAGFYLNWNGYLPERYAFQGYFKPTATATFTLPPPTPSPSLAPAVTTMPRPTSTQTFAATATLPSPTQTPIAAAPTPQNYSLLSSPVVGFADKIAVIAQGEVWVSNLDGSDLTQVTSSGGVKSDLKWTPDGSGLVFMQDFCFKALDMETGRLNSLGCFTDFEISPDMQQMVLGKKIMLAGNRNRQWLNFLAPFDWDILPGLANIPQQPEHGGCPFRAGYQLKFSPYEDTMAAIFSPDMGVPQYLVRLFRRKPCGELNVNLIDEFPGARFRLRGPQGTNLMPTILDFGWDGASLFAVHGDYLHGYGEMVIYNSSAEAKSAYTLYPVQGQCCYQDIQWSPDGSYLLFVFQDARFGVGAEVYYIPYDVIKNMITTRDFRNASGVQLTPIPFPDHLFADHIAERVEPALRQAVP